MESESAIAPGRELDFHPGMDMRWDVTRSTEETFGEDPYLTSVMGAAYVRGVVPCP